MFKNDFKIAWRTLVRQPAYSIINISGLAIGMACCILILLFVYDESSYDRFHAKAERIYRVVTDVNLGGGPRAFAMAPSGLGRTVAAELPEVESFTRMADMQFVQGETLVKIGDQRLNESGVLVADSTFFEMFSYEFLSGDAETALDAPGSVVITQETARRLFGDEGAIGKTVELALQGEFHVTGVVKDPPRNSHFTFNYIFSTTRLQGIAQENLNTWRGFAGYTYLLLAENADVEAIIPKLNEAVSNNMTLPPGASFNLSLQKLTDIHLHSHREFEIAANGETSTLYIFSAIAAFVLIIACINFISLATAKSSRRAREIGLRKVFGAYRGELVRKFLNESILLSLFALLFAVFLVEISLPVFNAFMGKSITFMSQIMADPVFVLVVLFGVVAFVGFVAGGYPAFWLSAFQPIVALTGRLTRGQKSATTRKTLAVVQFAISIFLIAGVITVIQQLRFMKNQPLGFEKEQMLVLEMQKHIPVQKYATITNELTRISGVEAATLTSSIPGRGGVIRRYLAEGQSDGESHAFDTILSDFNFASTFDLALAAGRDLSAIMATDSSDGYLINETAAQKFGWAAEEAVGKQFTISVRSEMGTGRVVGVLEDFHYTSLKQAVEPVVVKFDEQAGFSGGYLSLRLNTTNLKTTLAELEEVWRTLEPEQTFDYFFLRDDFERQYRAEERLSAMVSVSAGLAIFVACLGLFAFAAYSAEQRTKEIGVRKVLGASVASVANLLTKDFVKLVLFANLIAWPAAWLAIENWLQGFAYRVDIGFWVFFLAGGLTLVIAISAIAALTIRAALANPVEALRYE